MCCNNNFPGQTVLCKVFDGFVGLILQVVDQTMTKAA